MAFKKNRFGSYILQDENGQEFTVTKKEKQEIDKLVKRANQRRVDVAHRLYDDLENSEVMLGKSYDGYMKMMEDKGFITEKYSSSLQQFNSKDDVKELLSSLKQVTKKGYADNRIEDVRYSMLEKVKKNYGSDGDLLYERLKRMDKSELMAIYLLSDKSLISDLYGSAEIGDSEVEDLSNADNTFLDVLQSKVRANELLHKINNLTKNSTAKQRTKTEITKSWNAYRSRKARKKSKKKK